jgi:amino acid transporter
MKNQKSDQLNLTELIAIGVGGMIGGGIFSVLGIAVGVTGHAAPLAFALGGVIAMFAGYSYIKLALAFRSDGASFTYLERAFPKSPSIAGIVGWTVIVGYVGTLALYAFTFGAYAADLLGNAQDPLVRDTLSAGVLLFFMIVNLLGVRSSGITEDLIVFTKIMLLGLFAVAGLRTVQQDHLLPVFDEGKGSVFIAGATIFVAFEGFQLITNAVCEMKDPVRNVPRGIYGSIIITTIIYLLVSIVAIGNLTRDQIMEAEEYVLAVAAKPSLGEAGTVLVGIAALLATSSAINATMFGASRMMAEMATEKRVPKSFSFRRRDVNVPWVAVVTLAMLGILFAALNSLQAIAAFSSLTFLLVSVGVAVANLKLHKQTNSKLWLVIAGIVLMLVTIIMLVAHTWLHERETFISVAILYASIFVAEFLFSKRSFFHRTRTGSQPPTTGDAP